MSNTYQAWDENNSDDETVDLTLPINLKLKCKLSGNIAKIERPDTNGLYLVSETNNSGCVRQFYFSHTTILCMYRLLIPGVI